MEQNNNGDAAVGIVGCIFMAVFYTVMFLPLIVGMWKVFTKAGKPGWASIVPIYNAIVILEIIGKPLWWIILLCIPCVNWIFGILVSIELAKKFGKGTGFAIGLILVPWVFLLIMAFDDSKYLGPNADGSLDEDNYTPAG